MTTNYDAIIIGGGLGGASVAGKLAREGHKVLVLEREVKFKDRVRGEVLLPWGVASAKQLGILDALLDAGAIRPKYFNTYAGGAQVEARDMPATTQFGEAVLDVYHPDMQEALLHAAMQSGAQIFRGATVTGVESTEGREPSVTFEHNGAQNYTAKVVIGADGRASQVRHWAGFQVQKNPDLLMIAGNLVRGVEAPEDGVHFLFGNGIATFVAPLGNTRARVYFIYPGANQRRGLSGKERTREFLELSQSAGAPSSWYKKAESIGPLAEFNAADQWIDSPAKNGIALVGDAAAATDPSWGCGLSLTLLDAERITNALCSTTDWNAALERYAKEHDEYYGALHRVLDWMTELFWSAGPEADERRAKVLPRMLEDPTGFPDSSGHGPFGPSDEQARRLILGLD